MLESLLFPVLGGVTLLAILWWLIGGAIVGWLAGQFTNSDRGFFSNAVVGIIGSILGGLIASIFNLNGNDNWFVGIIFSVIGAVTLTLILRQFKK